MDKKRWFTGFLAVLTGLFLLTGCSLDYEYLAGLSYGQEQAQGSLNQSSAPGSSGTYEDVVDEPGENWQDSGENGMTSEESWEDPADTAEETDSLWGDEKPFGGNLNDPAGPGAELDEYGVYTSMEDVALYLYLYEDLPENFITKKEAQALGWEGGSLEPYAPGMCIGGDYFGNYEGNLPEKKGRKYYECDIDTLGARSRGAKRIVYSDDGLIYYTEDHYETFILLYGEE